MKTVYVYCQSVMVIVLSLFLLVSCAKDITIEMTKSTPYSIPCLEWKTDKDRIVSYMDTYSLADEDPDYLCYSGKMIEKSISYQFKNGELTAVVLIIPCTSISLVDLKMTLFNYNYLGEINGEWIYIDEVDNSIATIKMLLEDDISYYALGLAELYH